MRPTTRIRWEAVLGGALGAAVGLAVGLLLAPTRAAPARTAADVPAAADVSAEVLAELRAIRELLGRETIVAPGIAPGIAPGAQQPLVPERRDAAAPDYAALVEALVSLEIAVRTAGAHAPAPAPAAGLRSAERDGGSPRPADLDALRATRGSLAGPGVQVLPELFGLSPPQVYARFGTPAVVGNSPGRVRWMYEDPDFPGHIVVTFFDGYVGWIHAATE